MSLNMIRFSTQFLWQGFHTYPEYKNLLSRKEIPSLKYNQYHRFQASQLLIQFLCPELSQELCTGGMFVKNRVTQLMVGSAVKHEVFCFFC